jgi:hypothetical protein
LLHAPKAKLADKNFNWKISWKARLCIAFLDWNEGFMWKLEIYRELGFPQLSPEVLEILKRDTISQEKRHIWRKTQEFKSKERENRWAAQQTQKDEDDKPESRNDCVHIYLLFGIISKH